MTSGRPRRRSVDTVAGGGRPRSSHRTPSAGGEPVTVSAYEVRVSGPVEPETLLDLGVVARGHEGAQTVLYGQIKDESALFGLLTRLRDLGLEVMEVRRSPSIDWIDTESAELTDTGE